MGYMDSSLDWLLTYKMLRMAGAYSLFLSMEASASVTWDERQWKACNSLSGDLVNR